MDQLSFASLDYAAKKKRTKRDVQQLGDRLLARPGQPGNGADRLVTFRGQ